MDWGEIHHYLAYYYKIGFYDMLDMEMIIIYMYYEWAIYQERLDDYKSSLHII